MFGKQFRDSLANNPLELEDTAEQTHVSKHFRVTMGLAARLEGLPDPTERTGPDVWVDLDVAAAASDAARVSGGALHATHVPDSSSMSRYSPSVATTALWHANDNWGLWYLFSELRAT